YLAVWAASRLYGYLHLGAGLVVLSAIVLVAAALAVHHDSEALAVLSLVAGFLNPAAAGALHGSTVLAYAVALDLGALALGARRPWQVLVWAALLGSWTLAFVSYPGGMVSLLGWGTVIAAVYAGVPFLAVRRTTPDHAAAIVSNGLAYLAFVQLVLWEAAPGARGPAAFGIAAGFGALWLAARTRRPSDTLLARTHLGLAVAIATVAVGIQRHGLPMGCICRWRESSCSGSGPRPAAATFGSEVLGWSPSGWSGRW
ncbi:MAG TPA: DUF2339 domain-containing protein, partial [Actinomycetota bacterium]